MVDASSTADALVAGESALARGAWADAASWFTSVLEHGEHPVALEGLSWAHWWREDLAACLTAREGAYHGYRATGDHRAAARMALWIGDDHLWFRGAPAVAEGWFSRARRLLDGLPECPEHGWLAVFHAHVALGGGDLAAARRLAHDAQRIGRSQGLVGLELFALATDGVVQVEQGRVSEGLRCLDEAAAAALAGEYEHLAPAAWSCCLLLSACDELREDERGAQWCDEVVAFSRRIGASFVVGNCRSHYGSILTRRGRWAEAERELGAAVRSLAQGPAWWRGDALARLGELRRRQGRQGAARRDFEQAGEHWLACTGLAAMCLDEGDVGGAAELAERALRHAPPGSPRRADALDIAVRSRLARGDLDMATSHAQELERIAEAAGTRSLWGTARLCSGRMAAASGDAGAAAGHYADAVALFERAGAPLEAAQARLELARALIDASRVALAESEARRAHATLTGLGAGAEAARAAALVDVPTGGSAALNPLTPRQVEVLGLAADGLTEQEIAERLVLSEHTVHRHLGNIYTRLGCSSRAAAVAQASRMGLL